jgi:hypothetical protein
MLLTLYNWFYEDYSLDSRSTTMDIIECKECKIWIPIERAPFRRRKKKVIKLDVCRPCKKYINKCKLTKSNYY